MKITIGDTKFKFEELIAFNHYSFYPKHEITLYLRGFPPIIVKYGTESDLKSDLIYLTQIWEKN